MSTYYNEAGGYLGVAWSITDCDALSPHKPHPHNPEHTWYGPYFCHGVPRVGLYDTPERKPV